MSWMVDNAGWLVPVLVGVAVFLTVSVVFWPDET